MKLAADTGPARGLLLPYVIANGVLIDEKMACSLDADGKLIKFVTGAATECIGVNNGPARTGNAAGTVKAQILPAAQYEFRAARPAAVAAVDVKRGMFLDQAADGIELAASVNDDFRVEKYDADKDEVWGFYTRVIRAA